MADKLSAEQLRALNTDNSNIIVSAQAGAGKTLVLVKRILRLIEEEKADLSQMLIVTFTNKAAQEMKSRIRRGLAELVAERTGQERARFLEQLSAVTGANIQTMHAFCLEVIREHYDRIGRDPGFRILDERRIEQLRGLAMDEVLDEIYEDGDEGVFEFFRAYGFGNRRSDRGIRELVESLYDESMKTREPSVWLDEQLERMTSPELVEDVVRYNFETAVLEKLRAIARYRQLILRILIDANRASELHPKLTDFLAEELARWDGAIFQLLPPGSFDEAEGSIDSDMLFEDYVRVEEDLFQSLVDFDFPRWPTVGKKAYETGEYRKEKADAVKDLRDKGKAAIQELQKGLSAFDQMVVEDQQTEMAQSFRQLMWVTERFARRFRQKKLEESGVDFSDVEQDMLRILEDEEVCGRLRERFRYIFFDEYQDSSDIQDMIVDSIAREDNLFFVGDIKQSIYGFRNAEPRNFLKRYDAYAAGQGGTAVDLTANFRSQPAILHFINCVFDKLMTKELGDVTYASATHRSRPMRPAEPFAGEIEISVLAEAKEEDDGEEETERRRNNLEEITPEAFYVAQRIRELVSAGESYRDIAVLFRTKQRMRDFETVFEHFGIPYFNDSSVTTTSRLEVALFLELLRVVDNASMDVPLISALARTGGLSDEELAEIRLDYEDGPYFEAVRSYLLEHPDSEIGMKLGRFFADIDRYRRLRGELTLSELGWRVLEDSGLYAFASALPFGEERRENLRGVLNVMQDYEQVGNDLSGFLRYITRESKGKESEVPTTAAVSENDNIVRLMTIHKSKGLEFGNVFLVEMQKQFNEMDQRAPLNFDSGLGTALTLIKVDEKTGLRLREIPYGQKMIRAKLRKKERAEAVRVLYVAMTRAERRLILVGRHKQAEKLFSQANAVGPLSDQLDESRNYLEWVVKCLLRDSVMKSSCNFPELIGAEAEEDYYADNGIGDAHLRVNILNGDEVRTNALKAPVRLSTEDREPARVAEILDYSYPRYQDTLRPVKRTVSQLSKKNDNRDERWAEWPRLMKEENAPSANQNAGQAAVSGSGAASGPSAASGADAAPAPRERSVPAFLREKEALSAMEIGTLTHLVLQQLPIREYDEESLRERVEGLLEREVIDSREAEAIDYDMLLRFYSSPLAARIARADEAFREQAFTMRYEDSDREINVDGQIDVLIREGETYTVIDFKTDRRAVPERYRTQLAFYAAGVEHAMGKPVREAILFWTRSGSESAFARDELHLPNEVEGAKSATEK